MFFSIVNVWSMEMMCSGTNFTIANKLFFSIEKCLERHPFSKMMKDFLRNLLSLVVLFQCFIFFFNFSFSVHFQRLFLPIPSFHHQQFWHFILSVLLIMVCKYDEKSLIVNFWIFLKKLVLNLAKNLKEFDSDSAPV